MPEWLNGAVSKTVGLFIGSGGSNPSLSALLRPDKSRFRRAGDKDFYPSSSVSKQTAVD